MTRAFFSISSSFASSPPFFLFIPHSPKTHTLDSLTTCARNTYSRTTHREQTSFEDNTRTSVILEQKYRLYKTLFINEKNDFAERFKILLDTYLKIILLDHQNNFVEILKIMSNAAKIFDILATSLNVLHNYFDSLTKLLF